MAAPPSPPPSCTRFHPGQSDFAKKKATKVSISTESDPGRIYGSSRDQKGPSLKMKGTIKTWFGARKCHYPATLLEQTKNSRKLQLMLRDGTPWGLRRFPRKGAADALRAVREENTASAGPSPPRPTPGAVRRTAGLSSMRPMAGNGSMTATRSSPARPTARRQWNRRRAGDAKKYAMSRNETAASRLSRQVQQPPER